MTAAVLMGGLGAADSPTPSEIFKANRKALLQPGTRELDGVLFVTQSTTSERRAEDGSTSAAAEMLHYRIERSADWSALPPAVRRAALFTAPSCLNGPVDAAGLQAVAQEPGGKGVMLTVHALPAQRLAGITLGPADLVGCLRARLGSGKGTVLDALLVTELDARPVSREEFTRWLTMTAGEGFAITASGGWRRGPTGLDSWKREIGQAIGRGEGLGQACNPLPAKQLAAMDDPGTCLALMGQRANDAGLLQRTRELLGSQGWKRSAELLPERCAPTGGLVDRVGSQLPPPMRQAIATSDPFTMLLVSDGTFKMSLPNQAGANYGEALAAFNAATPESIQKACMLLAQSIADRPDLRSMVLLSASFLALNDPAMALPLARVAFNSQPDDPYAGVNALLAAKLLGRRELVLELLPQVQRSAQLDAWGAEQLRQVQVWLTAPSQSAGAAR